jgi:WD40 repeat protein
MRPLRDLPGHKAPIWCVAFSPDGKKALSAGGYPKVKDGGKVEYEDCAVHVWDVAKMQELSRFNGHTSEVKYVTFLPDGRHVLSVALGVNASVSVWEATNPNTDARRLPDEAVRGATAVTSSADGRYLLVGTPRASKLLDLETSQELQTFKGRFGFVSGVALSRDAKYALTTVSSNDGSKTVISMHLWDVATGRELRRYPKHPSQVERLAFTPDGQYILSAYENGTIYVWETGIKPGKP